MLEDVFHDRQAQARPAALSRTPRVDTIEPFCESWNMLGSYAFTIVDHLEHALLTLVTPDDGHGAFRGRMVHGIDDQIRDHAAQLFFITDYAPRGV